MAQYLVYWKTYWKDTKGRPLATIPNWNTDSLAFINVVRRNDTIWVVVAGGANAADEWRLLQKFDVSDSPRMQQGKWGRYFIPGRKRGSLAFDPKRQPDFTAILWMLDFSTGKPIRSLGQKIGQSLQVRGYRTLSEADVQILKAYAKCLRP